MGIASPEGTSRRYWGSKRSANLIHFVACSFRGVSAAASTVRLTPSSAAARYEPNDTCQYWPAKIQAILFNCRACCHVDRNGGRCVDWKVRSCFGSQLWAVSARWRSDS